MIRSQTLVRTNIYAIVASSLVQPRAEAYNLGNSTLTTTLRTYKNIDLLEVYINLLNRSKILNNQSLSHKHNGNIGQR